MSRRLPISQTLVQFFILLTLGPLLGSFITEPAAVTIVALLLLQMLEHEKTDTGLLYGVLALLFVNISVGGALTHFAAPPILMVARVWNWSLQDVFLYLGKAATASVLVNTLIFTYVMREKIISSLRPLVAEKHMMPTGLMILHVVVMVLVVHFAHEPFVFTMVFLIFIGLTAVSKKYQSALKFREGFLVAFFLAGLIVFGSFQRWWLEPLIQNLDEKALYLGAIGLTAVTDNAALTYLGSQVSTISDSSKWALVSGALVGGGLTILANAPNPVGFSILGRKFPDGSLNAGKLFLAALPWTLIAGFFFLVLGKF
jgi:hypothetical protein